MAEPPRPSALGLWAPAPHAPALLAGELHLWRAALTPGPAALAELGGLLSDDELERAARFVFARDRDRFVAARGQLRRILGAYLGAAPGRLRFAYGAHGKPELGEPAAGALSFNLSHSGDLALYAVARNGRVGVDVELVRHNLDYASLLHDVCSPRERQELAALPEAAARARFFQAWVCKEAYIKARGEGLAFPPAQVEALFAPAAPPALGLPPGETAPWTLRLLDPGPGYVAAAVVEAPSPGVQLFDINIRA